MLAGSSVRCALRTRCRGSSHVTRDRWQECGSPTFSLTSLVLVFIPALGLALPSSRAALEALPPHWLVSKSIFVLRLLKCKYLLRLLSSQFGHGSDAALFVSVDDPPSPDDDSRLT